MTPPILTALFYGVAFLTIAGTFTYDYVHGMEPPCDFYVCKLLWLTMVDFVSFAFLNLINTLWKIRYNWILFQAVQLIYMLLGFIRIVIGKNDYNTNRLAKFHDYSYSSIAFPMAGVNDHRNF